MNNPTRAGGQGVWQGWYWRFVGIIVVVLAVLEIIAFYWSKGAYSFITSGELAMFIAGILVVQRVKERRTANTLVAVLCSFVINIIFQLTIGYSDTVHYGWGTFLEQNLVFGVIGVLFAIVYARMTAWSEKRRKITEQKRREKQKANAKTTNEVPQQRVHRIKKKQGRGKR